MLPYDDGFVIFLKYAILYTHMQLAAKWLRCLSEAEGCAKLWVQWDTDPF
jgi:hypothetical protein